MFNSFRLILMLAVVGLAACNGDGSTDAEGSGGGAVESYLFYRGGISAVDSANPTNPITVEAGTDVLFSPGNNAVLAATYDRATRTLSNLHIHALVYAKSDGKLYKVNAEKAKGVPVPVQLSSETAADKSCGSSSKSASDIANPEDSQFVYRLPGSDSICDTSDDVYKMVRLSMSATDAPITAKAPIAELNNEATGALSAWLVNDGGALKRCDTNFANCGPSLKSITGRAALEEEALVVRKRLLTIDDALYVYDDNTHTLSSAIYTLGSTSHINVSTSDAHNFYFSVSDAPKSIYAAPTDGSAVAVTLVTDTDNILDFQVSSSKVVYTTKTSIKTVATTGGSAESLVNADDVVFIVVNGSRIYYNTLSETEVPTAGVIDDSGGNKSETVNAHWVGFIPGAVIGIDGPIFKTFVRAEGYNGLGSAKGFSGGTLRSFDAANAEIAVLGSIPSDIRYLYCGGLEGNSRTLCRGFERIDLASHSDIFFLNAEIAGSFQRVTTTPTKNEDLLLF